MNDFAIVFFRSRRGVPLVKEFIRKQDKQTVSKIGRMVDLLRKYGPDLGMPHSRHLGGDLYEVRVRGKNEVRIFYICVSEKQIIVLLHAFAKRTQKLPKKELQIAKTRQNSWTIYNT